jgi:hypothetical protein
MIDGLSGLVSPRSAEDIFAERVRIRLGQTDYVLPVLPMGPEQEWKSALDASFDAELGAANATDVAGVVSILERYPDKLLDALITYDRSGVLPPREKLLAEATQLQVLKAVLEVRQSANPLAAIGLGLMTLAQPQNGSSAPSSTPARPGRGRRRATSESP